MVSYRILTDAQQEKILSLPAKMYRASSLNLVIAATVLWNTLFLEMAIQDMQRLEPVSDEVLNHLSPMRWQHIRLSGDYVWKPRKQSLIKTLA